MPDPKGFPKIRGTILGVPNIKDHSILGSMLGSPYFGKLPLHITRGPPEVALQHTAPRRHSKAALQGLGFRGLGFRRMCRVGLGFRG